MAEPAASADWKTLCLPDRHTEVADERLADFSYSPDEWERIRMGLRPEEMEDRWFIYAEGDRVFFHRSWTGYRIFVADFAVLGERRVLQRLLINRDPEQYAATDAESDVRYVARLIDLLLGKPGRFQTS